MPKTSSRGFTLVELLIVVIVIAILATFSYPVYISVQERARATQDMNNLRQIGLGTQRYLTDSDNVLFSTSVATSWMKQLQPKYLPAWSVFQSAFDKRTASEDSSNAPVSYGINANNIIGGNMDKITNPSVFILFAPAQNTGGAVSFLGLAGTPYPGVTVRASASNQTTSVPGGSATGGTHLRRSRIAALCADLHAENMLWKVFTNTASSSTDQAADKRWTP